MSMSQPLDPLHGGPTRGIPSVTVLRKTVNPSVVDLKSRADAPTPGQMSVIVCQANDDHPQEDDHYLENDQVAPELSTGSEPSTTERAIPIILSGKGTKEIESDPVRRVQSSLVHGTISSSKDHGVYGEAASGDDPEPITGTRGTELSPYVEGVHGVHSDKTHLGTEESDARLAEMQASYPSHSLRLAHKVQASTAGGPGSHVSDSVAVVPPPEAIVVSKESSLINDHDQPPPGGGHNDDDQSNSSNLHQSGAVKQYESTPRHGRTRKPLSPAGWAPLVAERGAPRGGGEGTPIQTHTPPSHE